MRRQLLGALSACSLLWGSANSHAIAVSDQGTWETTLQGRDLDGNLATFEAYYDTALDITWLANANYAGVEMDWSTAEAWAASLTPYNSGINGWRLPTIADTGTAGCNYSYTGGTDCGYNVDTAGSEMAHMFYVTLGNLAVYDTSGGYPQPGWGLTNTGPFSSIQSNMYWSAIEYGPNTDNVWFFSFRGGDQVHTTKTNNLYAWAVRSGDVGAATVPVPAAAWLFGSGLLGLIGVGLKHRDVSIR